MSHGVAAPLHRLERQAVRARAAFRAFRGAEAEAIRAREIAALPSVTWKGKPLKTLRCHGQSGNGPHDCNVPEGLLWSLISLEGDRADAAAFRGHAGRHVRHQEGL